MPDLQKALLCAWEITDCRRRQRNDGWGALIGEMDQLSQLWIYQDEIHVKLSNNPLTHPSVKC